MSQSLERVPPPILTEDYMIKYLYVEQLARLFKRLGDLNVLGRRCDVATRVVVGDNDGGGIGENRDLENLTG